MTIHYFDPSVWVKRYFQERGSEAVNDLFRSGVEAACCRLGVLEMVATVARKSRAAALDPAVTQTLLSNVHDDFAGFRVIAVDDQRTAAAMDALHLACALSLRPAAEVVLATADLELLTAASQQGLATFNPAA